MADNRKEPVVVIGLGRFGEALALELLNNGTEVLAVYRSTAVVQSLSGKFPHVVTIDSTDIEALREIGVADFHRAVVAIGTDMEASILTASLLSELGVADIWAKAISRLHGRILQRVGVHHVVLPEHDMGERVAHRLSGGILDYLEIDRDYAMVKTTPPRDAVGVALKDARLRRKYGVTVVAVKSEAKGRDADFTHATGDTVLMYGDQLVVLGRIADVERFAESS